MIEIYLIEKGLTKREREIALLAGRSGKSGRGLADELFVCEKTIRFHLTSIYRKLGLKRRGELQNFVIGFGGPK